MISSTQRQEGITLNLEVLNGQIYFDDSLVGSPVETLQMLIYTRLLGLQVLRAPFIVQLILLKVSNQHQP